MWLIGAQPKKEGLVFLLLIVEVPEIRSIINFADIVSRRIELFIIVCRPHRIPLPPSAFPVARRPGFAGIAYLISVCLQQVGKHRELVRKITSVGTCFFQLPDIFSRKNSRARRTALRSSGK